MNCKPIRILRNSSRRSRFGRAFTLVELLVTIGVIGVLAGLILSAVAQARSRGDGAVCLSNMRQVITGWTGYPLDHDQQLPPNNDQPMAGRDAQHPSWVAGWLRLDTEAGDKTDSTNVTLLVGDSLAEYGSIGPYIGEPKVYRCVRDRSTVNIGGQVFARARTLAMNAYMNGKGIWNETNYATFRFLEEIKDPSGTWVLLEEREDSINDGYFAVRMSDQYVLIDTPANYHQNGCYFSFADGHVELKKWVEGTTSPPLVRGVHLPGLPHYTSFLDRDLQWVTSRTTWLK